MGSRTSYGFFRPSCVAIAIVAGLGPGLRTAMAPSRSSGSAYTPSCAASCSPGASASSSRRARSRSSTLILAVTSRRHRVARDRASASTWRQDPRHAGLSFLGLAPTAHGRLGRMLATAGVASCSGPHVVLCRARVFTIVLALNFVVDAVRALLVRAERLAMMRTMRARLPSRADRVDAAETRSSSLSRRPARRRVRGRLPADTRHSAWLARRDGAIPPRAHRSPDVVSARPA